MLGNLIDPVDRTIDGHLPMHFRIEEPSEKLPHILLCQRFPSRGPCQRIGEAVAFKLEAYTVTFLKPLLERSDHMQQHLIAVAYHQGASHVLCSLPAAITCSGVTAKASDTRIRSGS